MQPYPREVRILVDNREKRPVTFPAHVVCHDALRKPHLVHLVTEQHRLPVGDYLLDGHSDAGIVERKGSPQEVFGNLLTGDRRRIIAAFTRLAHHCRHPILLLDFALTKFFPGDATNPDFSRALSELLRLVWQLRLHLVVTGTHRAAGPRRKLGEFIAKLLISAAFDDLQADATAENRRP